MSPQVTASKDSKDPTDSHLSRFTVEVPWGRIAKTAAYTAGAIALFYAVPNLASAVHDCLTSTAVSVGSHLPANVSGWLAKAGAAVSTYLPTVSSMSADCRKMLFGAVVGAGAALAATGYSVQVDLKVKRSEDGQDVPLVDEDEGPVLSKGLWGGEPLSGEKLDQRL